MTNYVTFTSDKRKLAALILCILGGILYTLTGGLCGIGWIIDIFRILLGSFRDNTGAPLRR